MSRPELIEAAFVTHAAAITGVATALPYEPGAEALPTLPCVTMLWSGLTQDDVETGPATANTWTWSVRLYVALDSFRAAQDALKTLVPELLAITRRDPGLGYTCEWADIGDEGGEPTFNADSTGRFAVKVLQLRAYTTET